MRISVASVGLNPLLPKNPATNLPARSFRLFLYVLPAITPPRSRRERKVGSPSASVLYRVPLVTRLHISRLPPPEKWPVCSRAQEGDLSAHLALPQWCTGCRVAALSGSLVLPALPHLTGCGHSRVSPYPPK